MPRRGGARDSAARSHGQGPVLLCGLALANASPFSAAIAPTALSGSGHAALSGSGHAAVCWPPPWWKSVAEQIVGSLGSELLARARQLFYGLPKTTCQATLGQQAARWPSPACWLCGHHVGCRTPAPALAMLPCLKKQKRVGGARAEPLQSGRRPRARVLAGGLRW